MLACSLCSAFFFLWRKVARHSSSAKACLRIGRACSRLCLLVGPCAGCQYDYQASCPDKWEQQGASRKCAPPTEYSGACRCCICIGQCLVDVELCGVWPGEWLISMATMSRCLAGGPNCAVHIGSVSNESPQGFVVRLDVSLHSCSFCGAALGKQGRVENWLEQFGLLLSGQRLARHGAPREQSVRAYQRIAFAAWCSVFAAFRYACVLRQRKATRARNICLLTQTA